MRKLIFAIILIGLLTMPARALDLTAPTVPNDVQELMPAETESFGQGLWKVIRSAIAQLQPQIAQAGGVCAAAMGIVLVTSLLGKFPGGNGKVVEFAGCVAVGTLLLSQTGSMIQLAARTVEEISQYGKLLLPVMAAAQAAQGGTTASAALYAGTMVFDSVLCTAISKLMVPMVYMYLALAVAGSAIGEDLLKKLQELIKWLVTWCLKNALYIFTGYMSITGVVSGAADAAKLKATKLTISGMVPVVGGILSDASEAVLVAAGMTKSAVGAYGVLAVAAIWISPFLTIGIQYLLLKMTAALCAMFGVKSVTGLIQDFSTAMGLLLGMTAAVCILLLISTVCLMKEVG